jgi:hypothetical protein
MSLDIRVYTKQLSDDLIPKIIRRLNDFEMTCEVHPDFSFKDQTGFLPFKFRLTNPAFNNLKDKELISGFELFIEDFDFETEKQNAQPKQGFLDKLLGKKQPDQPLINPDIDKRLKDCKKMLSFVWHADNSFDLRFAQMTSAILTELTDGVCTYTADDIWYDTKDLAEKSFPDIRDYELTLLKDEELEFYEFKGWDEGY